MRRWPDVKMKYDAQEVAAGVGEPSYRTAGDSLLEEARRRNKEIGALLRRLAPLGDPKLLKVINHGYVRPQKCAFDEVYRTPKDDEMVITHALGTGASTHLSIVVGCFTHGVVYHPRLLVRVPPRQNYGLWNFRHLPLDGGTVALYGYELRWRDSGA